MKDFGKLFAPVKEQLNKERGEKTVDQAEIDRRIELNKSLCATSSVINFGPTNGICWNCKKQIFEVLSGESTITGCPFCHRTYCD